MDVVDDVATNRDKRDAAVRDKTTRVEHLPSELTVAATDQCNLRCVICGTHHRQEGDNNAGLADFPPDMIPKVAGMTAGAERIQVHGGGGEPLMSRSFWHWVSLFDSNPDAQIEFNTNGLLFNESNIARLMERRVSVISVSCDASTPEMYKKIRGGDFNRLTRNIANLVKERDRQHKRIRLGLNMTIAQANVADAPGLVRMAHELGLDVVDFYKMNDGAGYTWTERTADGFVFDYQDNLPERNIDRIRPFVNEAVRLGAELGVEVTVDPRLTMILNDVQDGPDAVQDDISAYDPPEYSQCTTPWRWLNISANGDVYPCCMAAAPVGSLKTETLAEVWNNDTMQTLRKNIRENRIDPKICKGGSCSYVVERPHERKIRLLEAKLQQERAARDRLDGDLAALAADYEVANRRIVALETSRSWRLTAPIRQGTELLRSGKLLLGLNGGKQSSVAK